LGFGRIYVLADHEHSPIICLVPIDLNSLPQDPAILQQMLVDLTAQLDKTQRLLRQLLAAKAGTRSEQLSEEQLRLFGQEPGVEHPAAEQHKDDDDPPPASGSSHREDSQEGLRRGRRPLPSHLKRERMEHDLTEEEKHCASCRQDMRPIGEESSERYEWLRSSHSYAAIHARPIAGDRRHLQKIRLRMHREDSYEATQPIEKSTAGASLLAHVIVSKIADHLPVHRQGKILERLGVRIPDQTMGGWLRQSAELLTPLYGALKDFVLSSKVTGTDDTPVKVLDKSLEGTTRTGRFWPYVGDRDHPAVVFDYTPTRERAGPEKFLENYQGYLQADAYVAYDSFFIDPARGLVEVACWAHYLECRVIPKNPPIGC
jgi:transposase